MKMHTDGTIEGTPEEIAKYKLALRPLLYVPAEGGETQKMNTEEYEKATRGRKWIDFKRGFMDFTVEN